jgi:hypothetical protein
MCNEPKIKIELGDGRLSQEIVTDKGVRQGCNHGVKGQSLGLLSLSNLLRIKTYLKNNL